MCRLGKFVSDVLFLQITLNLDFLYILTLWLRKTSLLKKWRNYLGQGNAYSSRLVVLQMMEFAKLSKNYVEDKFSQNL
jgi:hypothetical protein